MANPSNQAKQIAASLLASDGTYTLRGDPVTFPNGYQVGGVVPELVNPTLKRATEWVARNWVLLKKYPPDSHYFGSWTDALGVKHLDVSDLWPDRDMAMIVARIMKEKAVWDWANMAAIEVLPELPA